MYRGKYGLYSIILSMGMCLISGCGMSEHNYYPIESMPSDGATCTIYNFNIENYMNRGTSIQYFPQMPQRILADGLEETEMVLAFAEEKDILAVYGYYDLEDFVKPQFKEKINRLKVLKRGSMNLEHLLELNPDFIVAEQCSFTPRSLRNTDFWNRRGIRTYAPKNTNSPARRDYRETMDDEIQYIRDFGQIFRKTDLAEAYIEDINKTLTFFAKHKNDKPPRKVMVVGYFDGLIASYDCFKLAGDMVQALGGIVPKTLPLIGKEDFIQEDPDIIFVVCDDGSHGELTKEFVKDKSFQKMKCIQNKAVYSIELENMYAPGIRLKDGIECIGLAMYPELEEEYWKTQEDTMNPSYRDWLKYKSMKDFTTEEAST